MGAKLSSRQLAQLAYLESLPPRFGRIYAVIEEMASLRADDVVVRGLARLLDQIKAEAGPLSLTGLSDTAGLMSSMTRGGGGLQMKVRGLRALLGSRRPGDRALRVKAGGYVVTSSGLLRGSSAATGH